MMNDFRYLLMRIIRLALTIICEAIALACIVGGVFGFFLCAANIITLIVHDSGVSSVGFRPWFRVIMEHPFLFMLLVVPTFFMSLSMAWAAALPYRFKWRAPGVSTKVCRKCHKEISDSFNCPECGVFRPSRLGTAFVQLLNLAVCGLWIVHDCIMWIFVIAL